MTRSRYYRPLCVVLVAAFTLLAAAIRLCDLGSSLWLDELHTAWTVSGSFDDVLPRARIGHQSPLFFWIEWCVVRLLGLNEAALRLPSLAAGIALVPITAAVAYRWSRASAAGAFAAVLVAVDYFCIWYSQEARPYALVQLVALLHVAVFAELCRRPAAAWRVLYVLLGLCLFHLQYTAGLLFAGELVFYCLTSFGQIKPAYRPVMLISDLALMAVGMLPVWPWLADTAAHRGNWAHFVPLPSVESVVHLFPVMAYVIAPLAIGALVESVCRQLRGRPAPSPIGRELLLVACWLLVPVGIALVCTSLDIARVFYRRYLMICALAPMLASALLWARLSLPARAAFALAAMVLAQVPVTIGRWAVTQPGGGAVRYYLLTGKFTNHDREDWRSAVQAVQDARDQTQAVFVRSGLIETADLNADTGTLLHDYALLPVTGIYSLKDTGRPLIPLPPPDRVRLNAAQLDLIVRHGGAWFILRGADGMDRALDDVVKSLASRGFGSPHIERRSFPGVTVLRVAI